MPYLLMFLLSLLSTEIIAATPMPEGCYTLPLAEKDTQLKTKKPSLFLIHNQGEKELWLTHPIKDPGASAGWTSKLSAGHWSALNIDNNFALSCVESTPGHEQEISCKSVLEVCKYKKLSFPEDSKGSYWAGENLKLSELMAHLGERGFKLAPETE